MKTLANCKPSEFLRQTAKIRKQAEEWIALTNIMGIRKQMPDIPKDASVEERRALMNEQARKNLSKMLDAVLEQYPDETLKLIAAVCFIEPDHVDDYSVEFYLNAISEIIGNEAVLNFFTSLMRLEQMSTSSASRASDSTS